MKLPISQYRGVLRLKNHKWGAQICKNKQHIWLGNFSNELEAAKTYDLAAQALYGYRATTNFKTLSPSDGSAWAELLVLRSHTTAEIVNMLQMRTYAFNQCLHKDQIQHMQRRHNASGQLVMKRNQHELLFRRVISLSDIETHTRLRIPRQQTSKYLPFGVRRGMVQFEDEGGKLWKFQYTSWRGFHNLKSGWAYFARKKRIKQGDIISFWRVADELGAVRLLIHCDTRRSANVVPSILQPQPNNNTIRLFGVDITIPIEKINHAYVQVD
ncbi:AP2/B3 transcription factor family protein [Rhynchospora pubera]|uniref:AP2/B3 transcription factor family protein n=1 Tax=Rhynchospora pubera TaxID=906938 RepID=A0AAV8G1D4_9POAL|nr:AP2/B3 transcription factor family protein [Rhynchospora pubera]